MWRIDGEEDCALTWGELRDMLWKNKGSHGIYKMGVDELLPYLRSHGEELRQSIADGSYKPNSVRRAEIPKDNGKTRPLGIPTVVDRVIQQAILKCKEYMDEGYRWVVDIDLEKYFDTVNHDKLIGLIYKEIKDIRVIGLIRKYLNAGVMEKGFTSPTLEGVPHVSIKKLKGKLKSITGRSNAMSMELRAVKLKQLIGGWIGYFKLEDMKSTLRELDEWLRRRLQMNFLLLDSTVRYEY